jgi:6-phospho-beta-glucosidase
MMSAHETTRTRRGMKLVVIGGGSSYTPELIDGLIRYRDRLPVREVWLVDIEAGREKLEIVAGLAQRMVAHAGAPMAVHATLDRRTALEGADAVITQFRVGLLEARARDERIALRHGCIGQETTGAGGFAKALRTIPVILDICRDMRDLVPGALLVNFTNPAGLVTEAVLRHGGGVPCIGVCNLPITTRMHIARYLGVEVERVEAEIVGINHLHWVMRVWLDGQDVLPDLLEQMARGGQAAKVKTPRNIPEFAWDPELLQSLRAIPCSYLRYYYMADEMLADQQRALRQEGTRADVVMRIEHELFDLYRRPDLCVKPPQLAKRGGAYYSEVAVQLLDAVHNHRQNIQTLNVRNGRTLPFLSEEACIEANCVIGRNGARPVPVTSDVSPAIRGLIQLVKAYEELTIQAAVNGDRSAALQALTLHPLVPSAAVARRLLDDILREHAAYLPQFR